MEVCGSCGAVALPKASTCGVCEARLDGQRHADPLPEGLVLVGVRCRFQCRGCGQLSPLDRLDLDGTVRCARCSLDQAFDVGSWREALSFAHSVGDLAGPEPEGRSAHPHYAIGGANPYRKLGTKAVWAVHAVSGEVTRGAQVLQRSLEIRAHPGRPLCSCGAPLSVHATTDGVETRCPSCGARSSVQRPAEARGLCPSFLASLGGASTPPKARRKKGKKGASEDRDAVGLTGSQGFTCPGCGAPLPVTPGARLVTCAFCKLTSPLAVQTGSDEDEPDEDRPPAVWWMAFEGDSALRRELLREQGPADADPSVIPEPAATPPAGLRWGLRQAATWGFPAVALGIAVIVLIAALWVSQGVSHTPNLRQAIPRLK